MPPTLWKSPDALAGAWAALLDETPGLRVRNAAGLLGVSEAELLATRCGDGVRALRLDVRALLPRIEALGPVMALTRNDLFVHEKTGVYENIDVEGHAFGVVGTDIDLRIFPDRWAHGFAVESEGTRGTRRSLQFFDPHGVAVHKIFLREGSDLAAYEVLVHDFLRPGAERELAVEPASEVSVEADDASIDADRLGRDWRAMRNTHDFFSVLRHHNASRTQAFRLVDAELAERVDGTALRVVLEGASENEIDLMIFVRSPGTFQIHHGPARRIKDTGDWLNILDPGFSLHVREKEIASSWRVRKPTEQGPVTSIEFFDASDELCALIFGCRGEGQGENPAWRALAESVPSL